MKAVPICGMPCNLVDWCVCFKKGEFQKWLLDVFKMHTSHKQSRLTNIIGPQAKQCTGTPT